MKLIIEGNEKKVKQLHRELITRCKRDNLELSIIDELEESEESELPELEKPKRGRKPNK